MKRIAGAISWLLIIPGLGLGQWLPSVPEGGNWKYLNTPHFKILFQSEDQALATRTAILAEMVHRELSAFLRWRPADKTRIIILDNTDQANALATPFPRNTIIIYPASPQGRADHYRDWLYELLLHEYTHILQIDMATGFWGDLRRFFGRVILPNAAQPLHQIEGLAVYTETRFSSYGRNNSALTEGLLRMAAISHNWPPLDRVTVFNSCWPWDAPYLYGGGFTKFLADSFGEGSLAEYHLRHAGQLPLFPNRLAQKLFGADFKKLWGGYTAKQSVHYRRQADSIQNLGLPAMTTITDDGYYKSSLAGLPGSTRIIYYQNDGRSHPAIVMMDPITGCRERILECLVSGSLSIDPNGRTLYFAELDYRRQGRELSSDLYRFDLENKTKTRLTYDLRARDPAPSPDGSSIYFVASRAAQEALCVLSLESGAIDTIFAFFDSTTFGCPRVSPQGGLLAFSARSGEGYQDIYIYDLATRECRPLTLDRALEIHPCWSRDGKYIYFCSDRSGTWNIYRYHLDDHSLQQVTWEIGGAFWPLVGDDGLWAIVLTGRGYEIARINFRDMDPRPPQEFRDRYLSWECSDTILIITSPQKYYPLNTLAPVAWLPIGFISSDGFQWGAALMGADDLMRHHYLALLAPNIERGRLYYDLQYQCLSLPVSTRIGLYNYNLLRTNSDGSDYYEGRRGGLLDFSKTFLSVRRRTSLGLGYHHRRIFNADREVNRDHQWWTGNLATIGIRATFSNARRYALSISPERGRSLSLTSQIYDGFLGSDCEQIWLQADWTEYLPLHTTPHVLVLSFKSGHGFPRGEFLDEFYDEFKVRGWRSQTLGRTKLKAGLEYRFPLKRIERGRGLWPAFLHVIHGALYLEAAGGESSFDRMKKARWRCSLGLELGSDWTIFYGLPCKAKLGLARPLRLGEDHQCYLNFELPYDFLYGKK